MWLLPFLWLLFSSQGTLAPDLRFSPIQRNLTGLHFLGGISCHLLIYERAFVAPRSVHTVICRYTRSSESSELANVHFPESSKVLLSLPAPVLDHGVLRSPISATWFCFGCCLFVFWMMLGLCAMTPGCRADVLANVHELMTVVHYGGRNTK